MYSVVSGPFVVYIPIGIYLAKIDPKKVNAHSFELNPIIMIGEYYVMPNAMQALPNLILSS